MSLDINLRDYLHLKMPNVYAALESVFEEHFKGDPTTHFSVLAQRTQEVYSLTPINPGEAVYDTITRWELELLTSSKRTLIH